MKQETGLNITPEQAFEYQKPPENEDKYHRLILKIDGEMIGTADLEYRSKPFPFYYLDYLTVDPKFQGAGYGSQILEQVNQFLREKQKPGILTNAIDPSSKAHRIYESHGWEEIEGASNWYGYRLGEDERARAIQAIHTLARRASKFFENIDEDKKEAA